MSRVHVALESDVAALLRPGQTMGDFTVIGVDPAGESGTTVVEFEVLGVSESSLKSYSCSMDVGFRHNGDGIPSRVTSMRVIR